MKLLPPNLDNLRSEVRFTAVRSRGPGGQNVNKVSSAAMLSWNWRESRLLTDEQKQRLENFLLRTQEDDPEILVRSDEFRDLPRNKDRCLEKLASILAKAFFVPRPRRPTRPTRGSQMRRREGKARRSQVKQSRRRLNSGGDE